MDKKIIVIIILSIALCLTIGGMVYGIGNLKFCMDWAEQEYGLHDYVEENFVEIYEQLKDCVRKGQESCLITMP